MQGKNGEKDGEGSDRMYEKGRFRRPFFMGSNTSCKWEKLICDFCEPYPLICPEF